MLPIFSNIGQRWLKAEAFRGEKKVKHCAITTQNLPFCMSAMMLTTLMKSSDSADAVGKKLKKTQECAIICLMLT